MGKNWRFNRHSLKKEEKQTKVVRRPASEHKVSSQPSLTLLRVSKTEFGLDVPFHASSQLIKTLIKQHQGRWCPLFKIWKIPANQKDTLLSKLQSQCIQGIPQFVSQALKYSSSIKYNPHLQDYIHNSDNIIPKQYEEYFLLNCHLYQKLYKFQKQCVYFNWLQEGRSLIGDAMGVGKSLQALATVLLYEDEFPLLIVCPSALKMVWRDQIKKWLRAKLKREQVQVVKTSQDIHYPLVTRVLIISYQLLSKHSLKLNNFKIVICDEAHHLKNSQSKRAQQLIPYLSGRKRVLLLTGTPALANPRELFPLLRILRPNAFANEEQFCKRYCHLRFNQWSRRKEYQGAKHHAELHYLLKFLMIRRTKEDVLSQLPPKIRQVVRIQTENTAQIQQCLINCNLSTPSFRKSQKIIHALQQIESQECADANLVRAFYLTGVSKLKGVKEYISTIIKNEEKIIIFAHHKEVIIAIETHLIQSNIACVKIDGSVGMEERQSRVQMFQEDAKVKAIILSVTIGGVGYTLTAASAVVFAQLHWTPAVLQQAEDRAHRIGQRNAVNVHYLVGENTIDGIMMRNLQSKVQTVGMVLDGVSQQLFKGLHECEQTETYGEIQNKDTKFIEQQKQQINQKKITDYFQKRKPIKNDKIEQRQIIQQCSQQTIMLIQSCKKRRVQRQKKSYLKRQQNKIFE